MIWAEGARDFMIRDLTFYGRQKAQPRQPNFTLAAIHLHHCRQARVSGCVVREWPSDGIGAQGGEDIQIWNCQAHNCRGHGFHPGTGIAGSIWTNLVARGNAWDGLYFCARVHHTIVSNCVLADNGWNGIGGVGHGDDHHNIISNNVCTGNGRAGIHARLGEEHLITGNLCMNNSQESAGKWAGVHLANTTHTMVISNRCTDDQKKPTQQRGVAEEGESDYNLITGNMCLNQMVGVSTVGPHTLVADNLT